MYFDRFFFFCIQSDWQQAKGTEAVGCSLFWKQLMGFLLRDTNWLLALKKKKKKSAMSQVLIHLLI